MLAEMIKVPEGGEYGCALDGLFQYMTPFGDSSQFVFFVLPLLKHSAEIPSICDTLGRNSTANVYRQPLNSSRFAPFVDFVLSCLISIL